MKWLWFTFTYFIKIIKKKNPHGIECDKNMTLSNLKKKDWFNENSINHTTRKKTHVKLKVPWIQHTTKSKRSKQ
jgi:hypothetical protein